MRLAVTTSDYLTLECWSIVGRVHKQKSAYFTLFSFPGWSGHPGGGEGPVSTKYLLNNTNHRADRQDGSGRN